MDFGYSIKRKQKLRWIQRLLPCRRFFDVVGNRRFAYCVQYLGWAIYRNEWLWFQNGTGYSYLRMDGRHYSYHCCCFLYSGIPQNKIFTMPQFLHKRYNSTVAMIMAVFWLLLYVVVNLTSILYLGALAVSSISGLNITFCMYSIAILPLLLHSAEWKW